MEVADIHWKLIVETEMDWVVEVVPVAEYMVQKEMEMMVVKEEKYYYCVLVLSYLSTCLNVFLISKFFPGVSDAPFKKSQAVAFFLILAL